MRKTARALLLALFVLAIGGVLPATAATTVRVEGTSAPAEICRFRADSPHEPFRRWFASQEVVCGAATEPVDFPAGLWNVFARAAGGISSAPVVIDGARTPADLLLTLVPAATLRVHLPQGQRGVIYVPSRAVAFPVTDSTIVPAAQPLWLFALVKSTPVAVIPIPSLEPGSERIVDATNVVGPPAVIGWLELADEDRLAIGQARGGVALPHIGLHSGDKEFETETLPPAAELNGALVLFRGAFAREAVVQLSGHGWLPERRNLTVGAQAVTIVSLPIPVRATAMLSIEWSANGDLAALDRSLGSCEPAKPARFDLAVQACAAPLPGKGIDAAGCRTLRMEPLQQRDGFGTVFAGEVAPGFYRAELRFGKLPPVAATVQLPPLGQTPIRIQARYLTAYGSLTRGGEPLHDGAGISFGSGGVGFAPRDGSDYFAVLTGFMESDAKLDITTCRGARSFVLTDREWRGSGRFDIDIPDNLLTVRVIDTFTREPLDGATLHYSVMPLSKTPGGSRTPRLTMTLRSGDPDAIDDPAAKRPPPGTFVLRAVPIREIRLQASQHGYKTQDVAPFSMTKSETKDVEIQMMPLDGSQGRIVSQRPFEDATIFWNAADGSETERADLAPDGSFVAAQVHYRGETMVVVSRSHPLWITRAPLVERSKPLEVQFPDAAAIRDATVSISQMPGQFTTFVGVTIGGLHIPQNEFVQHLRLRNAQSSFRGTGPLLIPALAETGPIDILRSRSFPPFMTRNLVEEREFPWLESRRMIPSLPDVIFGGP